MQCFRLVINN